MGLEEGFIEGRREPSEVGTFNLRSDWQEGTRHESSRVPTSKNKYSRTLGLGAYRFHLFHLEPVYTAHLFDSSIPICWKCRKEMDAIWGGKSTPIKKFQQSLREGGSIEYNVSKFISNSAVLDCKTIR